MHALTIPATMGRRIVLAASLAVFGIALSIPGFNLLMLGGSSYYVLFAAALMVCAYLELMRNPLSLQVYAVALSYSIVWAIWEAKGTIWGLQARLAVPVAIGIWIFWPWIRRANRTFVVGFPTLAIGAFVLWMHQSDSIQSVTYDATDNALNAKHAEWVHYGNDVGGSRHTPVGQITPANIGQLEVAWSYSTGAEHFGNGLEVTPIMVGETIYLCTADNQVHAIDAETGDFRWKYDPKVDAPGASACRGVVHAETSENSTTDCASSIIFATADARLIAVSAKTGMPCSGFGENGTVDLKRGMGEILRGYYYVSSAPALVRGKVIVGGWVMDNQSVGEPSGVIRAYDAKTGEFAWAWDMDNPHDHNEPAPGESYSRGTANSWAPMSGDEKLGLVYVPLGNATPDYWGAHRSEGSEKYASSVVALDIESGEAIWHFQTTHHDLWDYDVGSQPTLVDLTIDGELVPALIQPTKRGETFLLDRRNGEPLADIEEWPVPQGASEGDYLSPTQPFSVGMPAFDRTIWTEEMMWGAVMLDQLWCRIKFREARYDGPMTPPGTEPSLYYPSYLGGNGWGGVSVDPERGLMISNWNRMLNWVRLVPREEAADIEASADGGVHVGQPVPQIGTPFASDVKPFLSPIAMPCNEPPFGMLTAVDLNTRKVIWEKPLGTSKDSGPMGTRTYLPLPVGVPTQGGSMTTKSGITFIGASQERVFRAFDSMTGKLLWKSPLPAGGNAGPMSYISPNSGRQFVVIAAGGNAPLSSGQTDKIIAFALPKNLQVQ